MIAAAYGLDHRSGGLGVGGSNPLAPTISFKHQPTFRRTLQSGANCCLSPIWDYRAGELPVSTPSQRSGAIVMFRREKRK